MADGGEGRTVPACTGAFGLAEIARLDAASAAARMDDLIILLRDSVARGASIGYVAVPDMKEASAYWRAVIADVAAGRVDLFVAISDDGRAVGTIQVQLSSKPNQRHRADVAKLLVLGRCRRQGIGRQLLLAAEARACSRGLTLLTLDTRRGDAAEQLYMEAGWQVTGLVPGYALSTTGVPEDCIFFFKTLGAMK